MQIPTIDLHQDILLHQRTPEVYPEGYRDQTDFQQLRDANVRLVSASGFVEPDAEDAFADIAAALERDFKAYRSLAAESPVWRIVTDADDLNTVCDEENDESGILLHVEGLYEFSGKEDEWERLQRWYDIGWRSVGVVWNESNNLGGGTHDMQNGLSTLGAEFLHWAQARNMLIDLAHMNPPTFTDALSVTDGPVVISHGNASGLVDTNRNYTDEQIRAVAGRGGVIGVFFSAKNLGGTPRIQDVIHHIEYIVSLVGVDHVAVGTDFGGLLGEPVTDLACVRDLPNLWNALADSGFEKAAIEKIAYKNAQRVLQSVLS